MEKEILDKLEHKELTIEDLINLYTTRFLDKDTVKNIIKEYIYVLGNKSN